MTLHAKINTVSRLKTLLSNRLKKRSLFLKELEHQHTQFTQTLNSLKQDPDVEWGSAWLKTLSPYILYQMSLLDGQIDKLNNEVGSMELDIEDISMSLTNIETELDDLILCIKPPPKASRKQIQ